MIPNTTITKAIKKNKALIRITKKAISNRYKKIFLTIV